MECQARFCSYYFFGAVIRIFTVHAICPCENLIMRLCKCPRVLIYWGNTTLFLDLGILFCPPTLTACTRSSMEVDTPPSAQDEVTPPATPTDWCLVCREDGCLEVYSVPSFKLVFCVRNFSSAPNTLMDSGPVLLPR